jgi:nucleoside-diphosphate-sugar epimerase
MDANDGRVVSNFIIQALKGKPITIYGDESQTRSFCYVSDLMDRLIKLFFGEKVHEPINLGNRTPINMEQLAEEVLTLTRSNSKSTFKELPGDDPKQREPNISKARELLDWQPKVNRIAGLTSTMEYLKTQI